MAWILASPYEKQGFTSIQASSLPELLIKIADVDEIQVWLCFLQMGS